MRREVFNKIKKMLSSEDKEMNALGEILISAETLSDNEKIELYINSKLDDHKNLVCEMIATKKKSIQNFKKLISYVDINSPLTSIYVIESAIITYRRRKRSAKQFVLSVAEEIRLKSILEEVRSKSSYYTSTDWKGKSDDMFRRMRIAEIMAKTDFILYRKVRRNYEKICGW